MGNKKPKKDDTKAIYKDDNFAPDMRESVRHFIYSSTEKDYSDIDKMLADSYYPELEKLEKDLKENGPMDEKEADRYIGKMRKISKILKENPELLKDIELMTETIVRSYALGDREGYEFMRARLQKVKEELPVSSRGFAG